MNLRKKPEISKSIPLSRWIAQSYLRVAILPLLLIELTFLGIFWVSSNFIYDRNATAVEDISRQYIADLAHREGSTIAGSLRSIEAMTSLLARQTKSALERPYQATAAERSRYGYARGGSFATLRGGSDDAAAFYSRLRPIGPEQKDKIWRTSQLDPLLKDISKSNPLITQLYFNSWDSYNRIYPYFDTWRQYPADMNIPAYNFYYEADARHNPGRGPVWTDAYVDPAGSGWMVSSIAPVYSARRLEGVVGIDITINTLLRHVLEMDIPWNGYAVLVGRDGTMLAVPRSGEHDFGVKELSSHRYRTAIKGDIFKPANFNIHRRADLKPLAAAMSARPEDAVNIHLGGRDMIAAFTRVQGPGWTLVVLAPASEILAEATALRNRLHYIGEAMAIALLGFYVLFMIFLVYRTRTLSSRLSEPLDEIGAVMMDIGRGRDDRPAPRSGVTEIDHVSRSLVGMARGLSRAYETIAEQERQVSSALERERRINAEHRRFIDIISHEFRTPLTTIDSTSQILRRRADRLTPDDLRERSHILRRAVERCSNVITSALELLKLGENGQPGAPTLSDVEAPHLIGQVVEDVALHYPDRSVEMVDTPDATLHADPTMLRVALSAIIDNAARYAAPGGSIRVSGSARNDAFVIVVQDDGPGIPAQELPLVCDRFYRGTGSSGKPGAGIGLFLADQMARAHGGTLSIESEPGSGTRVTIVLPSDPRAAAQGPTEEAPALVTLLSENSTENR